MRDRTDGEAAAETLICSMSSELCRSVGARDPQGAIGPDRRAFCDRFAVCL